MAKSKGIALKKRHGQNFLRDERFVHCMFDAVTLTKQSSVLEIGCGDGFLTRAILRNPIERLRVYEIDEEWVRYIKETVKDERLTLLLQNFLDVDLEVLAEHAPWTVLANLPYHVTFPILHSFQKYRRYLNEGVIMVQEEVAQKITKTSGRGYGYVSLFFQHYFEWKQLEKVPPTAFHPAPKVFSRLLYFKPIQNPKPIPHELEFWDFIKSCFKQPRRTMRNNLKGSQYEAHGFSEEILSLRAQQMNMQQLLELWNAIISQRDD